MSLAFDVIRVPLATAIGNQNFVGTLGGLTPKLALFRLTRNTANDSVDGDAYYCRGATDGTNSGCVDIASEDGEVQTNGRFGILYGAALSVDCARLRRIDSIADGSNHSVALRFVSFSANTVTLNVRIAPPFAFLLEVVLFAGSDLTAVLDSFITTLGIGASTDRNVLGVPCDAAVIWSDNVNSGSAVGAAPLFEGFFARAPHSSRAWGGISFGHLANPSVSESSVRNDANKAKSAGTGNGRVTLSSLALGYRMTALDSHDNRVIVAALNFNAQAIAWAGLLETPTTNKVPQLFTAPLMPPSLALAVYTRRPTANTRAQDTDAAVFGGGAWCPLAQFGYSLSSQHGVSPTVVKSHTAARFLSISRNTGSLAFAFTPATDDAILATATAIAQGLSFTYDGASNVGRQVGLLVIGPGLVLVPDVLEMLLDLPAPLRVSSGLVAVGAPLALPLNVPAPTVVLPKLPSSVALALVLEEGEVTQPLELPDPVVPPELGPLYQESLLALLPRGLAWPRRVGE